MSRFFAMLGGEGNLPPPEQERAERARLQATLVELERVAPWGAVTDAALAELRAHYRARLEILNAAPGERKKLEAALAAGRGVAPETAAASVTPAENVTPPVGEPAAGGPAAAALPKSAVASAVGESPAPGPGLREFLAERSILIVSYVGAFLLIVATLLFELAAETFGGPVRFAGVLVLDLVFGAAAWVCWRSPNLRIVGTTYLAIFALIAPLVFVAAYVFLVLKAQGVSVSLAVAVGALSCAVLYGVLAARLRSSGYAALSGTALIAGWCGALIAVGLSGWQGAGVTPLPIVFCVLAYGLPAARGGGGRTLRAPLSLSASLADAFIHAAAAVAFGWTLLGVSERLLGNTPAFAERWALTATLGGLALDYAIFLWLSRRWGVAPVVALLTTLAALAAGVALGAGISAASLTLLALAWVYATLATRLPDSARLSGGVPLRALAAVQAGLCAGLTAGPDALQAGVLLAGTALGVFLAWSGTRGAAASAGARWWLLYAAALSSVAWFWLVKLALPPPPQPTFLGLLTAYAPLPVLLAAIGVVVSRVTGRRCGLPVYTAAALNALWVGTALAVQRDSVVPGWAYLAFAVTVYAVTALERFPGGAVVSAVLVLAGVASLLWALAPPAASWPPLLALAPWLVYAAGVMWERRLARRVIRVDAALTSATDGAPVGDQRDAAGRPDSPYSWESDWPAEHRWAALGLSALVALACFGVPGFYERESVGALSAAAALWSFTAMLLFESVRRDAPYQRAAAIVLGAFGSFWLARYVGLENAQWYVALPGLALLLVGYVPTRRGRGAARRGPSVGAVAAVSAASGGSDAFAAARVLSGTGLALLLGTTALQMSGGASTDGIYTAVLVGESVGAVLAGVALRQRVYVVFGAAGAALAALRALLMLLSQVPLFVVFGVAALLLLGLAALLAVLRERLGRAGSGSAAGTWADWD